MQNLLVFKNDEFGTVRTVNIEGEPYFVGKDVAEILGYSNPSETLAKHIDIEDKLNSKTLMSLEPDKRDGVTIRDSIGRVHEQTAVNEIVLLLLILSSKLPTAKKFNYSGCHSILEELL